MYCRLPKGYPEWYGIMCRFIEYRAMILMKLKIHKEMREEQQKNGKAKGEYV
jgi:hypothetical protein